MDEIIEVNDDGVTPIEQLPVTVTKTEEVPVFTGTLEELDRSIEEVQKSIDAETARKERLTALRAQMAAELETLPAREGDVGPGE